MGGKFSIAGTVIGVLIIQTLESTILFLGVPSAQSPVFFAVVVIIVVLIQSPRVHAIARDRQPADALGRTVQPRSRQRRSPHEQHHGHARPALAIGSTASHLPEPARLAACRRSPPSRSSSCCSSAPQIYFGNFITPRNMSALLLDNAYLLILAVGMTFVIVTGGIDLSVGSVIAFTGILCAKLLSAGVSPVPGRPRHASWSGPRSACSSASSSSTSTCSRSSPRWPACSSPAGSRSWSASSRSGSRTPASCGCSPPASGSAMVHHADRDPRAARRGRRRLRHAVHPLRAHRSTRSAAASSPLG